MLSAGAVFADNLADKHIYSFYTDNFNGAALDSFRDNDNVIMSIWGGGDSWPAIISTTTIVGEFKPKEGPYYYDCSLTGAAGGWSGFCFTFAKLGYDEDENPINVATTKNISAFSSLEFWIRPKTGDVSNIQVGITDTANKAVSLSSLGVDNSSHTWQKVTVPFSLLTGADLTSVKNVFLFLTDTITATFDLDGMVMRRSSEGSFDAVLKNRSDDLPASKITWDQTVFGSSWTASNQYIDLSLDTLTNYSWAIKIYTNNGSASKSGLVATTDATKVLPMCWRINKVKLPNGADTLLIAQGQAPDYNLYDAGQGPSDYYPWFYFKDAAANDITDYIIAWSYNGFHGAVGADYFYGMREMQVEGIYPKIYIGADFTNALGGLDYSSNIRLELSYE